MSNLTTEPLNEIKILLLTILLICSNTFLHLPEQLGCQLIQTGMVPIMNIHFQFVDAQAHYLLHTALAT